VDTAVRHAVGPGKDPVAVVGLELPRQDFLGLGTQDHRPGARLGSREQDRALLDVNHLTPEEPELAEAHEGEGRQFRNLSERRGHRVKDEDLFLGTKPPDAALVFREEGTAGKLKVLTGALTGREALGDQGRAARRAEHADVPAPGEAGPGAGLTGRLLSRMLRRSPGTTPAS
jgi:hypothetical protein